MRASAVWLGTVLAAVAWPVLAAEPAFPDAAASDPVAMGWMQGAPPPADKLVRHADMSMYRFPQTRWAFANFRQIVPNRLVWRGAGPRSEFPLALREDLDTVRFTPLGAEASMSWGESLAANYTDAILVLHRGRIVYERYFGVMQPQTQHMVFSVTKSFVGTLAATLIAEGRLDPEATVPRYVPELAGTAFGDATVRQVLDMTTGLRYSENYTDPNAEVFTFARAGGVFPQPPGYAGPQGFYAYLQTLEKEGTHGEGFTYKSVNTEVLGWILRKVTGKPLNELLSERFWQPLGAAEDGFILVDPLGTEFASGGLNLALRDLARFGEMLRLDGRFNGRQIVPKAVVDDIRRGGDPEKFKSGGYRTLPGWSYRNQWWVSHNEHGAYSARGVHGQLIYVDPAAEMVIVRFGSHPLAGNANLDPTSLPAYHALAQHLMRD